MRIAKWVTIVLGGLAALAVLAGVVLTQVIDPNRFRGAIERQVTATTGREFHLQGDIELSFFPWLALTTGAAELQSPHGFPERAFLRWRAAHVGVRLVPLLRDQLVVDRIRIEGLDARLVRTVDGRTNWSFDTGTPQATPSAAGTEKLADIAGVELRDAHVIYDDLAAARSLVADVRRLEVAPIRRGAPMRVELEAALAEAKHAERAAIRLALRVTPGPPLTIDDTTLTGTLRDGRFGGTGVPLGFTAPRVRYDATAASVDVPEWRLRFDDATLDGAVEATFGAATSARGRVSLAPVSLRATLAAAGITLPPTRDARAYAHVELGAGFSVSGASWTVDPLTIRLDDTRLAGSVTRGAGDADTIRFALHGDRIDLDRYLKPEGTPSEPFVLPTEALKALRVAGTLDIDEATIEGVQMKGVQLGAGP